MRKASFFSFSLAREVSLFEAELMAALPWLFDLCTLLVALR